ncbi:O-antigen ligase family protein [Paenibacillus sp. FSL M8-0334]|uniref:O-antigen ligase family protein n=1 Tax=Paenibacillus sp. FSL M8-0334 TaxID=2921623 RepID=UPI0030F90B1C
MDARHQLIKGWRQAGGWCLTALMLAACVNTGLFFDSDMYFIGMIWFGMLLIWSVAGTALNRGGNVLYPGQSDMLGLMGLAGIMLVYALHLLLSPLSVNGTVSELLRFAMYSSCAAVLWLLVRHPEGRKVIAAGWHAAGVLLCGSALLAVYGVVELPYAIYHTANADISATGARLGGLLQYPNTFGAVMAAYLLERLFALLPVLRSRTGPLPAAALLPLLPYAAALLLTESRGAWLAAALAGAAGLARERRALAPLLAAAAAPMLGAALLYRQLADARLAPVVLPGLLWLAGLWAGSVLAGRLLCRLLQGGGTSAVAAVRGDSLPSAACAGTAMRKRAGAGKARQDRACTPGGDSREPCPCRAPAGAQPVADWRRALARRSRRLGPLAALAIAAAVIALAAAAVMLQVQSRVTGGAATLGARGLMYRDAWELAKTSPWLGQGGDTWRLSYRAVQSEPYVGSEVHSGYMNLLLDTGGIGLLLIFCMTGGMLYRVARCRPRLLPPLIVLLGHALIDFDLSYGLVWLLIVWLAAMGMHAEPRKVRAEEARIGENRTGANRSGASGQSEGQYRMGDTGPLPIMLRAVWLSGVLLMGSLAAFLWVSEVKYEASLEAPIQDKRELLASSLRWNPYNEAAALQLAELLPLRERIAMLETSHAYSQRHPELSWKLAEAYSFLGDAEEAVRWFRQSLNLDPYHTDKQARAVIRLAWLAEWQGLQGLEGPSRMAARSALGLLAQYRAAVNSLMQQPKLHNDRKFRLSPLAEHQRKRLAELAAKGIPE